MATLYQANIFGGLDEVRKPKRSKESIFNDYKEFTEKFKPKKTTDDCYTPPEIYDLIRDWVDANLCPLSGRRVLRPFRPGGDYEAEKYRPGDIVLDNPPFSILSKIIDFYIANGVDFFLFAPSLTLFSASRPGLTYIVANAPVTYENGASVSTSFVTNLEKKHRVWVSGQLYKIIREKVDELRHTKTKQRQKIIYPDHLITAAILGKVAARGIEFHVPMDEAEYVRRLDNAKGTIFGGGYLLSERAAAERADAERAAAERAAAERVILSDREKEIIKKLSRQV